MTEQFVVPDVGKSKDPSKQQLLEKLKYESRKSWYAVHMTNNDQRFKAIVDEITKIFTSHYAREYDIKHSDDLQKEDRYAFREST